MGWQWWVTALPISNQTLSVRTVALLRDYSWLLRLGVGIGLLCLVMLWWVNSFPPAEDKVETGPATDPIQYANKPLSLRALYDTDFMNYQGTWTALNLDAKDGKTKVTVPWRILQDRNAKATFFAFYIPSYPADTSRAIELCKFIAVKHKELLEKEKPHLGEYISTPPGDSAPTMNDDLVFTGTVYLYIADTLSTVQEASIISQFKAFGLSAMIRSENYRFAHAQEDRIPVPWLETGSH